MALALLCSALSLAPTASLSRPAVSRASTPTMQLTKKVRLSLSTLGAPTGAGAERSACELCRARIWMVSTSARRARLVARA